MNYIKSIAGLLLIAFLTGCFTAPPVTDTGITIRDNDEYDQRKKDDEDRDQVISDSRRRLGGNECEDEDRNHDCKDICKDIYNRGDDRDDCEKLTVRQVEALEELHELLEDPDDDDLAEVDKDDFDLYLNVSIDPFDRLVGKYSSREAKEVMLWVIEDEDVAEIFEDEDDEYKTLEALLKRIGDDRDKPFTAKLDGKDRIMEVALDSSEFIVEWFMDFIQENTACNGNNVDETDKQCFEVYCQIADVMDEDYQYAWLDDFGSFEGYIDDVIEEGTNSSASNPYVWGPNNEYEDSGDLDESWVDALCKRHGGNSEDLTN